MKIIFDSEEQKKKFMDCLMKSICPSALDLDDRENSEDCGPNFDTECVDCWEHCGLEIEVKE